MRIGISVECAMCRRTKQPHGRSAPMGSSFCDDDCDGYDQDPQAGCLWPGETEEDLGFAICSNATKDLPPAESAARTTRGVEDAGGRNGSDNSI